MTSAELTAHRTAQKAATWVCRERAQVGFYLRLAPGLAHCSRYTESPGDVLVDPGGIWASPRIGILVLKQVF